MKQAALEFATKAHADQKRKNSREAYIVHPIRVAERLEQAGLSDEVVCAGYLHDVAEDTVYDLEDIEERFGKRITEIVAAHTEDKSKTWRERKQHTIDTVKSAEPEVKYLIVADKLDNLLDVEKALQSHGESVWDKFHAGVELQRWYNESIANHI